jgi:DNA polymerase III epsilon subunit-like protein
MVKKFEDIMIDTETLGTRADSVIISIGAVKFDPNTNEIGKDAFYASISIDSNLAAGRHISESTLIWWLQQSVAAQGVFHEKKSTLAAALNDLADWIDHPDYKIWSNGADFDIPMLGHAFSTHDADTPWKFYNSRCFRTMKQMPFGKRAVVPVNTLKHNALNDAIAQAQHLQNIYKEMK